MKPISLKRQRGVALLAMLAVIMLVASWFLVTQLNAESGGVTAVNRTRNAAVLNRAKLALIGYVAQKAATAGENNPGRLPCPEAVNNIGTADEGSSAPWIGPPATAACNSIGRLPWRTLGVEKLFDSTGEPLWYVVGPAWRLTNSASTLLINSNTAGDTTVDGQQVVALIIAPGAAMNVQAAAGCTARNQSRAAPAPAMDARDYLECFDSGTLQFVTTAASTSYNDQVVRITVADVMPAIEAAIANRIEREILPALQTVYTPAAWGFAGSNPVLPFPAPFASPGFNTGSGSNAGTSNYHGASVTPAGLLPFNQMRNCAVSAADPRCTSTVLTYSKASADVNTGGSGSIRTQSTCSWQSTNFVCTGEYSDPNISVTVSIKVANVAGGLRTLDLSKVTCTAVDDAGLGDPVKSVACAVTAALQSDGSVVIAATTALLPDVSDSGWNTYANYKINIDEAAFGDHALLSTTHATTGWFARNEWYRLVYYGVAASNTAGKVATERSCSALPADCLSVTSMASASNKSALLVLAGRSVNGRPRPSATLADYFEFGNAKGTFEAQSVSPVAAMIHADTGAANAYTVAVTFLATGAGFQFRATNANTGDSTLNTTATGTRSLLNPDGSNLAAATIQANAAVQVTWDGTQFVLSKRPFNDRIAAIAGN
jgi:hypothetical protein